MESSPRPGSAFRNETSSAETLEFERAPAQDPEMVLKPIIIYSVLFVISAIGNTALFISLIRNRRSKARLHTLILHLTIAGLIVSYVHLPVEIAWRITVQWRAGDLACRVWVTLRAFGLQLSSMVLVCISLDRYFAVLYPMKVMDARRRSCILLCFAWLISLVCSLPQSVVFHTQSHPADPDFIQCVTFGTIPEDYQSVYSTISITVLYVIPLIIIIICYSQILWTIHKRSRSSKDEGDDDRLLGDCSAGSSVRRFPPKQTGKLQVTLRRSDAVQFERAKQRTLRMTIIIVVAFVLCWTPYCSVVLLYFFFNNQFDQLNSDFIEALFMFAVSNTCVNPLVYGSYTLHFGKHFRSCFGLRKSKNNKSNSNSDSVEK